MFLRNSVLFFFALMAYSSALFACEQSSLYEEYMSSFDTFEASFDQKVNGKYNASGILKISRPDKMRIEYNKGEVNSVIVVNGEVITYLDRSLGQISYLPKNKTPVHFILNKGIKFAQLKANLCKSLKESFIISIPYFESQSGKIDMVFTKNPVKIIKIHSINENNEEVELLFKDQKIGEKFDTLDFVVQNPNL